MRESRGTAGEELVMCTSINDPSLSGYIIYHMVYQQLWMFIVYIHYGYVHIHINPLHNTAYNVHMTFVNTS